MSTGGCNFSLAVIGPSRASKSFQYTVKSEIEIALGVIINYGRGGGSDFRKMTGQKAY